MVLFESVDAFLQAHGVYERLAVDRDRLGRFLAKVETSYGDLPYHNLQHIEQVVGMAKRMWTECGLSEKISAVLQKDHEVLALAFVVAAAVHDLGHVGLTNDFLIRSHHPFAINFNDVSPNESHHAAETFRLLLQGDGECNFLHAIPREAFWMFRQQVIGLILQTDMSKHHGVVSNLRSRNYTEINSGELTVILQAVLKYADIGHTCLPYKEHLAWAVRLQREMLLEGDRWKEMGWLPPSSMDRDNPADLAGSQLAFFRFIVIPFLEALADVLPQTRTILEAARHNEEVWRKQPRKSMDSCVDV